MANVVKFQNLVEKQIKKTELLNLINKANLFDTSAVFINNDLLIRKEVINIELNNMFTHIKVDNGMGTLFMEADAVDTLEVLDTEWVYIRLLELRDLGGRSRLAIYKLNKVNTTKQSCSIAELNDRKALTVENQVEETLDKSTTL